MKFRYWKNKITGLKEQDHTAELTALCEYLLEKQPSGSARYTSLREGKGPYETDANLIETRLDGDNQLVLGLCDVLFPNLDPEHDFVEDRLNIKLQLNRILIYVFGYLSDPSAQLSRLKKAMLNITLLNSLIDDLREEDEKQVITATLKDCVQCVLNRHMVNKSIKETADLMKPKKGNQHRYSKRGFCVACLGVLGVMSVVTYGTVHEDPIKKSEPVVETASHSWESLASMLVPAAIACFSFSGDFFPIVPEMAASFPVPQTPFQFYDLVTRSGAGYSTIPRTFANPGAS